MEYILPNNSKHPQISQIFGFNFRYKFGSIKRAVPPPLPDPVATSSEISARAQGAGQEEIKRLKRRRTGTIFAGRRDMAPARTRGATLKPLI